MHEAHIQALTELAGSNFVFTDDATKLATNKPWRYGQAHSNYGAVVVAEDEQKLKAILRYCDKNKISIVVRSGGTALTNGSSIDEKRPEGDYIILKLFTPENIKAPEILENGAKVRVFPGTTTKDLNPLLKQHGRTISVDLGIGDKEGIAQLLGYIATDAAGTGAAFKGRARDIVESVRVAMLDGRIYNIPSRCDKCPSINEVIGLGGTTGIILEAVVKTAELPVKKQVAVVRIESISQMYDLLEELKKEAWDNLNLFERVNPELLEQVIKFTGRESNGNTDIIRDMGTGDTLFIELTSTKEVNLKKKLERALEKANLFNKSMLSRNDTHANFLLGYRVVNASIACDAHAKDIGGQVVAFDISVPTGDDKELPSLALIERLRERIPNINIFAFGHAAGVEKISAQTARGGTGLHFNPVVPKGTSEEDINWLREQVFEEVSSRGGLIVSEHTPGTKLVTYLKKYNPAEYQKNVDAIAKWNPNCTLNAGAYAYPDDVIAKAKALGRSA